MENLKYYRKKAGFHSQEQFAAHLGVRRSALAKWEIGMTCPRGPTIKKIAEVLNVSSDDVIDAITAAKDRQNRNPENNLHHLQNTGK